MTAAIQAEAITPRLRTTLRRWSFWVVVGLIALALGVVSLLVAGAAGQSAPLDPDSAAPQGTMAVAEVLRGQGVQVVRTTSLEATRDATSTPGAATLVIYDSSLLLDEQMLQEAAGLAETVVLLDPTFDELAAVAPEIAQAGSVEGPVTADCALGAVERAGTVTGDGYGFRLIDDDASTIECLGSGDDVYSLVGVDRDGTRVWALGAVAALTNERVLEHGNAAFALGLLGEHDRLVWYLPSFEDVEAADDLSALTPGWVMPVAVLLGLLFVLAAVWRGRRFGPLVIENLPVVVKSSETMLGRARLYSNSSSRLRALDALRVGTIRRLAAACGLPRVADVEDVVAAVASLTGASVGDIRRLLVDAEPVSDRDLVAYSDALLTLERDVARLLRP